MADHTKNPRICKICAYESDTIRFAVHPPTARCRHAIDTCTSCVERQVSVRVADGRTDKIRCLDCDRNMQYEDIRANVSAGLFERYDNLLTKSLCESIIGFVQCARPSCDAGQIYGKGAQIMTCLHCSLKTCISCRVAWHTGETCARYQSRHAQKLRHRERASLSLIARISKPCPGCTRPIQQNGGCSHMTCSCCKHEFCWRCSAPYKGSRGIAIRGNDAHKERCPFYRPQERAPCSEQHSQSLKANSSHRRAPLASPFRTPQQWPLPPTIPPRSPNVTFAVPGSRLRPPPSATTLNEVLGNALRCTDHATAGRSRVRTAGLGSHHHPVDLTDD